MMVSIWETQEDVGKTIEDLRLGMEGVRLVQLMVGEETDREEGNPKIGIQFNGDHAGSQALTPTKEIGKRGIALQLL